ncbi:hypothetical protein [Streptomyces avermitilis]|uniref:hypothetical protein n=1 Tax=Streptomyces avermitilis TaxID=33903 RepID=UPI00381312D0
MRTGFRNEAASPLRGPRRVRAKGIKSTRYVLTGAGHGDLSFTGDTSAAQPWSTQETMGHIVDFLRQHLT